MNIFTDEAIQYILKLCLTYPHFKIAIALESDEFDEIFDKFINQIDNNSLYLGRYNRRSHETISNLIFANGSILYFVKNVGEVINQRGQRYHTTFVTENVYKSYTKNCIDGHKTDKDTPAIFQIKYKTIGIPIYFRNKYI